MISRDEGLHLKKRMTFSILPRPSGVRGFSDGWPVMPLRSAQMRELRERCWRWTKTGGP